MLDPYTLRILESCPDNSSRDFRLSVEPFISNGKERRNIDSVSSGESGYGAEKRGRDPGKPGSRQGRWRR
jgi:hypothetical protein